MKALHYLLIGFLFLPGCKSCEKEDEEPPPMPSAPATVTQPPAPATLTTVEAPKGPDDVVRPELDQREDGVTGTSVTATGAKATLNVPSDWKLSKAAISHANSADGKAHIAIGPLGSETTDVGVSKAIAAIGVSGCQWGSVQSLTVGKDKLSAQAADGKCQRSGAEVPAAYMVTEGLVVAGVWDPTGNRSELFGSMRSVSKVATGKGGATNLIACCRVLAQNAKSAPPPQNAFMLQAAATCEAAARANNSAAVSSALRQFGLRCN